MKKSLLLTLLCTLCLNTWAQDVIITKEGDALKVFELEVSNKFVFYKENSSEDSPIKRVSKADLLMIKYNDGRKEIIGEEESKAAAATETTPATETGNSDAKDKEANAAALAKMQAIDIKHIGEKQDKKASILYCQCLPTATSTIADSNVELIFKSSVNNMLNTGVKSFFPQNTKFKVIAKNNSKNTIYIDLGNTFFIRGNQSMQCYVPTATSHTSGQTTGANVNMGAVAKGMGIGGAAGTIANGINVGGARTDAATTITYAQRIIAVPPFSESEIGSFDLFPPKVRGVYSEDVYKMNETIRTTFSLANVLFLQFEKGGTPLIGEERVIDDKDFIRFGMYVTYSFDEEQTSPKNLNSIFEIKKIIGTSAKKIVTDAYIRHDALSPEYSEAVFFVAYPKE